MTIPKLSVALSFLCLFTSNIAKADVTPQERLFADRVAMVAIDDKCRVFTAFERRAINAFMLQARGELLRNGSSDYRVGLLLKQARSGAMGRSCNETVVQSEIARVKKAYLSWRMQMNANFIGKNRVWQASRAGVDNWRAWQELGDGVRAGFVLAQNGLAFGVETPNTNIATMRVYWRDFARLGPPKLTNGLFPPPRTGTKTKNAYQILPAQTRLRLETPARVGNLAVFSNDVTSAIVSLDPRDCFEVEIVDKKGGIKTYIIEVGDVIAAFALGAEI